MARAVIAVKGMRKSYGSFEAVKGIDLSVPAGQVFALLGPNPGASFPWGDVGMPAAWWVAGLLAALRWFRWEAPV